MGEEQQLKEKIVKLEAELEIARAKLEAKENLFESILEGTLAGFWDWDIENNTEYLSPTFKQMFGYRDDEMENSPDAWQRIIFEEDLPDVLQNFEAHFTSKGQVPFDKHVRYNHKNGGTVHIWYRGKVIEWLPDGRPKRMVGSQVDVSELSKLNESLKHEAQRLALIIKGVNAGVWDWNIQTNEEWWSEQFYAILGYERSELHCGRETFLRLIHPEDRILMKTAIVDHLYKKHPFKIEVRVTSKDKGYLWMEVSGQALWNENNEALRISGSLIDINDRKLRYSEKEKIEHILKETGLMAKVGGWELTIGDMKPHWSDQVYHIHEVPVGQQPPLDKALSFYPQPDREVIEKLLQNAVENGEGFDEELNFITAKKNKIFVRSICMPEVDQFGKTVKLRGVFQDITEKKKQELVLKDSLTVLGEQNKRLQGFAHIVSHNLNSHTSNIKMLSKLLKKADNEIDRVQYLELLDDASHRLETTIIDLNEIVTIQNNVKASLKKLSFKKSFKNLEETLSAYIKEEQAEITIAFEVDSVKYIPAYLDSIFLNFVTNAIKYRHEDRLPKLNITSYEDTLGSTWLTFADNGMGINLQRNGHKLFGMYKTFSKHVDSKGLGLFITKTQVESLGGEILVESEVNQGTKFLIKLN